MKRVANIERAYFRATSHLASGYGSTQISELLLEMVGPRLCLLEVRRPDGRFTLAVDADWAEMVTGLGEIDEREDDLASLQLPRSALRAVIAGWPTDWDDLGQPRLEVHVSEDLLPHISLLEDDLVFDLTD